MIDGRVQQRQPMLATELGKHDVILGKMWFAEYGVLPDCKNHRLIWPEQTSLREEVVTQASRLLPRRILQRPQPREDHQKDVDRRDKAMDAQDCRAEPTSSKIHRRGGPADEKQRKDRQSTQDQANLNLPGEQRIRKRYGKTHEDDVRKMDRALKGESILPPKIEKKVDQLLRQSIDIAAIGGVGFHRHMQREGTETFITSLSQIDRILDEKRDPTRDLEAAEIRAKIPKYYHEDLDSFSKIESDTLPPLRGAPDHKIELEGSVPLGYCPLYKMTEEELRFAKDYIMKNLAKGFIVPSSAPYASPILMALKPGGGLRFCVDYRKLNALTKKDRYPIPLIDELLQRVSKAKRFTKLDIHQGFHRIRMHPDSEDLTTFRSRYGSFKYKVLPFGLTNGPATFQRYINHALGDYLDDFCTAFIDDILIYTDGDLKLHREHVKMVLKRLRAAGL
jgi:hypothetical protein